MKSAQLIPWHEANQRYLVAALAVVREALERHTARVEGKMKEGEGEGGTAQHMFLEAQAAMPAPAALETLCAAFGLSPFERNVLLLCAGVELDAGFAARCAAAQGDARRAYPTFSLALAALPDAHWSALAPAAPLRRWRILELTAGDTLALSPLRIEERVLHYLVGVSYLDERLQGLLNLVPVPDKLPPSHRAVAERMTEIWLQPSRPTHVPVIQLCGEDDAGKRAIAASAYASLGLQVLAVRAADLPVAVIERESLARLWEREASLSRSGLLVECETTDGPDHTRAVAMLIERMRGMLIISGREPLFLHYRTTIRFDVKKPSVPEQQSVWQEVLGPWASELNGNLKTLGTQFNLSTLMIRAAGEDVLGQLPKPGTQGSIPLEDLSRRLWDACRVQVRPRLDDLAQRIEPAATWEDLVLPEPQRQILHEMAAQVRQRATVYETWGFAQKSARGLGISALFVGASGTGKTMAAEVLANELRLDLYRIDLSQVVSKYIGETEKNLRRVFDAADEGGVILLFDEADALFGKRSEVRDSHDRYANIEVSYLLQRMEAYRGLGILTTNMKSALDVAFLRRIRFIVQFPFPDSTQRADIWRRSFPASTPTESLDVGKLARLNVAGGNIHNIALNAAFLAAEAGGPVRMAHVLRAARSEYGKLEKPLTEVEIGGWS